MSVRSVRSVKLSASRCFLVSLGTNVEKHESQQKKMYGLRGTDKHNIIGGNVFTFIGIWIIQ